MDNKKATLELGTKPVGKLLVQYAMPAIVAMVASSLYNMVDSIFIGQGVGPMAISGLAITFPFMNLSGAIGAGIGVGASTYLSVKLGQKDYSTAQKILGNSIVLKIITGILFGAICLVFLDPILRFFGATDNTIPYARDYMVIILLGNVFTHLYFGMNALLRAASKPRHAMYATIFTVVLNTALDPLFIYTFGMGIRGAALATILSQMTALCWQIWLFSNPNELLHFKRGIYRLDGVIIKNILAIGISPFSMNACACIIVIFINTALVKYGGDLAVGAYGIANRIGFLFFMIVMGINQGMQPIAGYNYGAEQYGRMMKVLNYSMIAATLIMIVGWLVGELAPYPCARMFTTDEQLIDIAIRGIRINMIAFPLIGSQAVITNFFQSIGKAKISIFLSLSRQMIYLLPLLIVLPPIMGVDGVWAALPASDAVAFITAWIVMYRFMKKHKQSLS
ncbi:MAG: MATE family efflux transporter [Prevotella sp.]|nr:MATE family efflux transporter [Prevotella sp.]